MRNRFDRCGRVLRYLVTGTVLAGLASCGGSSYYDYDAPNSVVIADFNGNGYLGIAVASAYIDETSSNEQPGVVAVLLQNTSSPGTFQAGVHYSTDGNPSAMATGDIQGNGSHDLAVANFNKGTISVLLETSPTSGAYQNQISVPTGVSPADVAICDVDGDGRADLVVANGSLGTTGGSVVWIRQTATAGQFEPAQLIGTPPVYSAAGVTYPNSANGVACANLNGDGHSMDVIITSFYEDLSSDETYGGSGTVSIFPHDPANPGQFLPRIDISVPGILHRVVVADINKDGLPDIIVSNEGIGSADDVGSSGAAVILQTTAAGTWPPTFSSAPTTFTTDSAVALAVADINGDGMPDIVIASGYANADDVEVMLNTTTPGSQTVTFGTLAAYEGLGNPSAVAIGDLNHDGLPDIATADGTGASIYIQGAGSTFTAEGEVGS